MQCPVCNAEVGPQNTFCTNCGNALQGASAPQETPYQPVAASQPVSAAPAYPPPPGAHAGSPPPSGGYPPPPPGAVAGSGGLSDTAAGTISYITIIPAIIFLAIEPYNKVPFVRFHSFQSIGLCVACVVVWIALMILQFVLHFVPLIGLLFIFIDIAIDVAFFVAWLMCIIKASRGEWFKLPIIGQYAENMARG